MEEKVQDFGKKVNGDMKVWGTIKKGLDKTVRHEQTLSKTKEEFAASLKEAGKSDTLRLDVREALAAYGGVVKEVQNAHSVYVNHIDETFKRAVDHQAELSKKMKGDTAKVVKSLKTAGTSIDAKFVESAKNYEREKARYHLLMLQHAVSAEMSYHAAAIQRLGNIVTKINEIDPEQATQAVGKLLSN